MEEDPLIPKVAFTIYKLSNNDGYYYYGLTKLSEKQCLKQHKASSKVYPNSKLYKYLGNFDNDTTHFEVIEEFNSKIGGSSLSVREIKNVLNQHIAQHIDDSYCLNTRYSVGLLQGRQIKCGCGGFYTTSRYKSHKNTYIHSVYEENKLDNSSSE